MRVTIILAIILTILLILFPFNFTEPKDIDIKLPTTSTASLYSARQFAPIEAEQYKTMLHTIAAAKGLPEAKIREIEGIIGGDGYSKICPNGESGWDPKAVGDNGTSFGLVQIHLPSHPDVTREQAEDAEFSINFIVDAFLKGDEWMWTCWENR